MLTIGILGMIQGVGCTHTAISIATQLVKGKAKVAVLDKSDKDEPFTYALGKELELIDGLNDSGDYYSYKNVDYFLKNVGLSAFTRAYDFLLIDYGTKITEEILHSDYVFLVMSGREWNRGTKHTYDTIAQLEKIIGMEYVTVVVPFASKKTQKEFRDFLTDSKILFPEYEENPFEYDKKLAKAFDISFLVSEKRMGKKLKELQQFKDKGDIEKAHLLDELSKRDNLLKEKEESITSYTNALSVEQAEKERLAKEQEELLLKAEEDRRKAEAEKQWLIQEKETEAQMLKEKQEKERQELLAKQEAERQKILAEQEAERQRILKEEADKQAKLLAEKEAERIRIETEKQAELDRIAKEKEESERLAKENEARLLAEQEAERQRIIKEQEEEKIRILQTKEMEAQRLKQEKEFAEQQRLAEEERAKQIAEEKAKAEEERQKALEELRQRQANQRAIEEARIKAEEEAKKAEEERLKAEEEKQKALEEKLKAEENRDAYAEEKLKDLKSKAEEEKQQLLAKVAEDRQEQAEEAARILAMREAEKEEEKARLLAKAEAERQRLLAEKQAELDRIAKEKEEEAERIRLEKEKEKAELLATQEAERQRLLAEQEAERQRILEENAQKQAELLKEKAEADRIAKEKEAEAERIRLEKENETARLLAEKEATEKQAEEEKAKLKAEQEKAQREAERLKKRLYTMSHDEVTGCLNRKSFREHLDEISGGFMVVYIDVDGLKTINDKFGHSKGDIVLKDVATTLHNNFPTDSVYRVGGDEFNVLLKTDNTDFRQNIEEILQKVCNGLEDITKTQNDDIIRSISYGYASNNEDLSIDKQMVVDLADNKMYEQKSKKHLKDGRVQGVIKETSKPIENNENGIDGIDNVNGITCYTNTENVVNNQTIQTEKAENNQLVDNKEGRQTTSRPISSISAMYDIEEVTEKDKKKAENNRIINTKPKTLDDDIFANLNELLGNDDDFVDTITDLDDIDMFGGDEEDTNDTNGIGSILPDFIDDGEAIPVYQKPKSKSTDKPEETILKPQVNTTKVYDNLELIPGTEPEPVCNEEVNKKYTESMFYGKVLLQYEYKGKFNESQIWVFVTEVPKQPAPPKVLVVWEENDDLRISGECATKHTIDIKGIDFNVSARINRQGDFSIAVLPVDDSNKKLVIKNKEMDIHKGIYTPKCFGLLFNGMEFYPIRQNIDGLMDCVAYNPETDEVFECNGELKLNKKTYNLVLDGDCFEVFET